MFSIGRDRALDPARRRVLLDLAMGTTAFGAGTLAGASPAVAQVAGARAQAEASDINSLLSEIWMEQVAVGLYGAAGTLLSPELRPVAALFASHHEKHLQQGLEALERLGGQAPAESLSPDGTKLPELNDDLDVLRYALSVETMAVDAYVGLVGQLSQRWLRVHAAQILGGELAHVIALRAVVWDLGPVEASDFAFTTDLSPYLPERDP